MPWCEHGNTKTVCACVREGKREGGEERIQCSVTVFNCLSCCVCETQPSCENGKVGVVERNVMIHKRLRD